MKLGIFLRICRFSLLRVLQERQVMRIGSKKVIDLDVHIIAASNKNLETLVQSGQFRSDLFYRLSVIPIELPPLRMRQKDILPLMSSFWEGSLRKLPKNKSRCRRIIPGRAMSGDLRTPPSIIKPSASSLLFCICA